MLAFYAYIESSPISQVSLFSPALMFFFVQPVFNVAPANTFGKIVFMSNNITLEDLLPYRDYMSDSQIARFGDYILRIQPNTPFTSEELAALQTKKEAFIKAREHNAENTNSDQAT